MLRFVGLFIQCKINWSLSISIYLFQELYFLYHFSFFHLSAVYVCRFVASSPHPSLPPSLLLSSSLSSISRPPSPPLFAARIPSRSLSWKHSLSSLDPLYSSFIFLLLTLSVSLWSCCLRILIVFVVSFDLSASASYYNTNVLLKNQYREEKLHGKLIANCNPCRCGGHRSNAYANSH